MILARRVAFVRLSIGNSIAFDSNLAIIIKNKRSTNGFAKTIKLWMKAPHFKNRVDRFLNTKCSSWQFTPFSLFRRIQSKHNWFKDHLIIFEWWGEGQLCLSKLASTINHKTINRISCTVLQDHNGQPLHHTRSRKKRWRFRFHSNIGLWIRVKSNFGE